MCIYQFLVDEEIVFILISRKCSSILLRNTYESSVLKKKISNQSMRKLILLM